MVDLFIQLPADDTGKRVDTEQLTVNALLVQRQRIQLAGAVDTDIAPCTAADGLSVNLAGNNDVTVAGVSTAALQLAADHAVDLESEHARNDIFVESVAVGGELDDTTPVVATEGNISPVRITAQRGFHVNLRDNAGVELGTTGNPVIITDDGAAILVDGSAVTQPISAASLPLPAGAATSALQLVNGHDVTVDNLVSSPAFTRLSDGTAALAADATTGLKVNLGIDNDVLATGNVAHDIADTGNPVKLGLKAIAHGAVTAVAADDRTDWYANRDGIPFVIAGHPNILTLRLNATGLQTNVAVITQGAGGKIVVTRLSAMVDNATTGDVQVRIGFGATTTPTTTSVLLSHPGLAAGSGVVEGSGSGILGIGADGDDLRITSETPTPGSLDIVVSYYIIDS